MAVSAADIFQGALTPVNSPALSAILAKAPGIPDEHGQHLLDITRAYFGGGDPEMQRGSDLIGATMAYMDFFRGIARERRAHPTNDVATLIATAEVDGSLIGEFEASSYFVALASAGHDTTSATLAGGLLALIQNPEEMRVSVGEPRRRGVRAAVLFHCRSQSTAISASALASTPASACTSPRSRW